MSVIQPQVIATDGALVVVDKPSGWVVHATEQAEPHDVQAWLAANHHPGCSPVHRLDRGASGIALYSPDPEVRAAVGRWFAAGEVAKRYVALVHRRTHRKGVLRTPLDGKDAVTRYRTVRPLRGFSLLLVRPETGRKHQIRRHLHGIGHPIVGDERYRPPTFRAVPGFPGRLFLHAARLTLPDGRMWETPLPPELQRCLDALGATPPT